jgi:serine/threonine protein kinase
VGASDSPTLDVPGCTDLVEIGRGGNAVVYRARQESFDRDVAVKVISRDALSGDTAARFVRECRAIGALSWHPNVVTVHDAGTTASGRGYLVMSWLDEGSLADEGARGPLQTRRVIEVGVALAGALEATHRAGRLHRDVKPANILVGPLGEPQLADFGIAAVTDQQVTVDGQVAFSPSHVPPEVIRGHEASPASDIYSLASTLYTLLAGRGPFDRPGETSTVALLSRISTEPPPDLRPAVPEPLWKAIVTALSKRPEDRPATAAQFAARLRRAGRSLGWDVPEPVLGPGRSLTGEVTMRWPATVDVRGRHA